MSSFQRQCFSVSSLHQGLRVDQFFSLVCADVSRSRGAEMIKSGLVLVNGEVSRPSRRLLAQDEVEVLAAPAESSPPAPEDVGIDVIYEDQAFVAVNKPPGLPVHPGAGRPGGTLANGLLFHYPEMARVGGADRPGIVHRLDMDTSGVLVVARTQAAFSHLTRLFAERRVAKTYLALVAGAVRHSAGTIEAPIARSAADRRRMRVDSAGKQAVTRFRLVAQTAAASLLALELVTGRTHQARVHLAAIGHSVVGDPDYKPARTPVISGQIAAAPALRSAPRQMLHAWRLSAPMPGGVLLTCWAAVPHDMAATTLAAGIRPDILAPYASTGWRRGPNHTV